MFFGSTIIGGIFALLGGGLLLWSFHSSVRASYDRKEVSSWAPYVWGAILGFLVVTGCASMWLETLIGSVLLLGSFYFWMKASRDKVEITTGKPMGWGVFLGFIMMGGSIFLNGLVGMLLVASSLFVAIKSANNNDKPRSWKPFVWAAILGVLLLLGTVGGHEVSVQHIYVID